MPFRNAAMPPKERGQVDSAISREGHAFVKEIENLAQDVLEAEALPDGGGLPAPRFFAAAPSADKARNVKITANVFFYLSILFTLLLALTLTLNRTAAAGIFGLRFFVEQTDAMKPLIPRGSLLVTVNRAPAKVKPGDVITYNVIEKDPDSRLTRLVDERLDNYNGDMVVYRTKRAQAAADSILINHTSVLGVKLFSLPYMGSVISFVQAYAASLAVTAAALCVSAVLLRRWLKDVTRFRAGKESHGAKKLP
ncbi:MAG: S24/S26 family peptidase [Oscillospiraceae bacterium]|nr:S24/S26 family peptidase [Oscillospiraceae bacterium]